MAEFDARLDGRLTDDAFLGGALRLFQPARSYRAGADAVLLAAAISADREGATCCLDAGAGAGAAGLSLARRIPSAHVTLLEREAEVAEIAAENVRRNGLADRVRVVLGDVTASQAELSRAGLDPASFDCVFANPPYHALGDGTPSRDRLKAAARAMDGAGLESWARFLARMARPDGTATLIHKAGALPQVLAALEGRFGALRVRPVHARAGEAAIRIIVQGVKGSRAPLTIRPGFVLHGAGQAFTAEAEAILRRGEAFIV